MASDLWEPKRRIESSYRESLNSVSKQMAAAVGGITDPNQIVRVLRKIAGQQRFQEYAESMALQMVTNVFTDTGRNWREAARESTRGREIYEALMGELNNPLIRLSITEQVRNNAKLITTLPEDLANEFATYIQEETFKGRRASEIAKDLEERIPAKSRARVNLIARTEASKASTALTRARSEALGLDWYIWRTSKDARVRTSHDHMEGVLISWKSPPDPEKRAGLESYGSYHVGMIWNCRCYPEPVVSLNNVSFPRRVHYNNNIVRMTKSEFLRII